MRALAAYKLFHQRRDGSLGPLFINRRQRIPVGEWLDAKPYLTEGYAFRPGWHCMCKPVAPHLKVSDDRLWCKVMVRDYTTYSRPKNQGDKWILAQQMKVVEVRRGR
jgi:hypothetical protein